MGPGLAESAPATRTVMKREHRRTAAKPDPEECAYWRRPNDLVAFVRAVLLQRRSRP
jgi:hypothetical protein